MSIQANKIIRNPHNWLILLFVLHVLGIFGLIGYHNLFTDKPVIEEDFGAHFYRAALLRESDGYPGLVWDPLYMGGYTLGGTTDIDNRLGELGVYIFRFIPVGVAWNWTLILLYSLVPIFLFLAAKLSGSDNITSVIASLLSVMLFWTMRSGDHEFLTWGLYGWVLMCALLPLLFTALQRTRSRPGITSALIFGISLTFVAYAHGLSILYVPFLIILFMIGVRRVRGHHILTLVAAVIFTAILVWPIIRPVIITFRESNVGTNLSAYFQATPGKVLQLFIFPNRVFSNAALILCLAGLIAGFLSRQHKELAYLSLATVCIYLFCFMFVSPSWIQPTRNMEAGLFLALIPASQVIVRVSRNIFHLGTLEKIVFGGLVFVIVMPIFGTWATTVLGRRPYKISQSPESKEIISHIKKYTNENERVLIEDSGDFFGGHQLGDAYILGYLARELNRELIGGPHPGTICRVSFATFVNGQLLGRSINEYSDSELRVFLETYNIGSVIVWSDISKDRFLELDLAPERLPRNVFFFRTKLAKGFAQGSENVTAYARTNTIYVSGAKSSPTILRWHFDHRFIVEPELPIKEVTNPFGPVGFIFIDNGDVSEFKISFKDTDLRIMK